MGSTSVGKGEVRQVRHGRCSVAVCSELSAVSSTKSSNGSPVCKAESVSPHR